MERDPASLPSDDLPLSENRVSPSPRRVFAISLSLCRQCDRFLARSLAAHLLPPPPLYVINSFPVLPILGNVSGDPDVCYTSYVYAAPCALLALRRSGKYCRHPLRDAKSDARKPVYRALVLFALYILYVPDSQRHFVHPRRFRTIWCLFVLEGRSVARRCILAVFFSRFVSVI